MERRRSSFRKLAGRAVLIGFAAVALGGTIAFKFIFPHSGERALDLVPENAALVATVDLDPALSQTLTFNKIEDALKRNGVSDTMRKGVEGFTGKSAVLQQFMDLSKRSISVCGLMGKGSDAQFAALIPLTDGAKGKQLLEQNGRPEFWKGTRFIHIFNEPVLAMVQGDTLVVAAQPWMMHEIGRVAAGEVKPITQNPEYLAERAREPDDANLICVVSPEASKLTQSFTKTQIMGWSSFACTIKDNGIEQNFHGKENPLGDGALAAIASIKPLRPDLLHNLPAGAYGVYAMSQPGQYLASAKASAPDDSKKGFDDLGGLNVDKDLIPGLMGDAVIAAYPSEQQVAGIDLLVEIDNQNGATPDQLAQKLVPVIDHMVREGKPQEPAWYTQTSTPDGAEFRLTQKVEGSIRSLGKDEKNSPVRLNILTGQKTVAWTTVGGTVFVSTSQALLDKAVAAAKHTIPTLDADAAISAGLKNGAHDQTITLANLSRVGQGVENTMNLNAIPASYRSNAESTLGLVKGLNAPLRIETSIDPDGTLSGTAFYPVDYDKTIDLIGSMMKQYAPKRDPGFSTFNQGSNPLG